MAPSFAKPPHSDRSFRVGAEHRSAGEFRRQASKAARASLVCQAMSRDAATTTAAAPRSSNSSSRCMANANRQLRSVIVVCDG